MTEDNFEITIGGWHCIVTDGELVINDCGYDPQDHSDDPTYDLVCEVAKLRGVIE